MTHLAPDQIIDVAAALHWEGAAGVRHIAACQKCMTELERAESMRDALAEAEPVDGEFVLAVMDQLPAEPAARPQAAVRLVNGFLATALAFFVVALGGATHPSAGPGPAAFVLVALCGLVAFMWKGPTQHSG